jgi:phage-related baseplate assembly protein
MDRSPKKLDNAYIFERGAPAEPIENDLSAFLNFPSLSRLFQGVDRAALTEIRSQLSQTKQYFERVIRQGTKEDAARAVLISRSYDLTLTLLEELEGHLGETAK